MPEEVKVGISSEVLAEKVQGMIRLTEEQFSTVKDSLKRIEQNNLGFATKAELEEVKKDFNKNVEEIKKGFMKHNEDDKESFGGLDKGQREIRDTIKVWVGALAVIAFFLPFIVPIVLNALHIS